MFIGDILKIGNGKDYKLLNTGCFPVFGTGGYMLSVDDFLYDGESVFIGRKGTINKPFYYSGKFWTVDTLFYTHSFNEVLPKFVYGLFQNINWDLYNEASGVPSLSKSTIEKIRCTIPTIQEQSKIADLLFLLDRRIDTQNKIIEDLKKLKVAIIENIFKDKCCNHKIGDIITQVSIRNKSNNVLNVLSVSNKLGFVEQSEQFEDRTVASEDLTNYKIVRTNDFAYNPARINVGSIARLKQYESGIVSPMYICFHAKKNVLPEYLEMFFLTQYFKHEMYKRLEGSVRLCLSFEGLTNIPIFIPEIPLQKEISEKILAFETKIGIEEHYLNALEKQKQYLLQQMFI